MRRPDRARSKTCAHRSRRRSPCPAGWRCSPLATAATRKWGPRWLERFDFEVQLASNRDDMMRLLDLTQPGVALIDIDWWPAAESSAVFSGIDEGPGLPVILLCTSEREVREGLESGATDVIRRPFDWRVVGASGGLFRQRLRDLARARQDATQARRGVEGSRAQGRAARASRQHRRPHRAPAAAHLRKDPGPRAWTAHLRAGSGVAVLHLDIDRFKSINDSYGRDGGNQVLKQIAQRLTDCVRSSDFVARHGNGSGYRVAGSPGRR